jgi:hypothetical protein
MVNFAARTMSFASAVSSRRVLPSAVPAGVSIIVTLPGTPEDGT